MASVLTDPHQHDGLGRGEYTWEAVEYGDGAVAVKIVDVLDETYSEVVDQV